MAAHDDPFTTGPVRLGGAEPVLLAVRMLSLGSPSMGGHQSGQYELVAVAPPGTGDGRVIAKRAVGGSTSVEAGVIDLGHDGEYEILVRESGSYANCDIRTGGGSSSTWFLMDGHGAVLWQDEERHREFSPGRRDVDMQAHVRPVDLFGDGRPALRIRTPRQEWYVVAPGTALPDPVPACIE